MAPWSEGVGIARKNFSEEEIINPKHEEGVGCEKRIRLVGRSSYQYEDSRASYVQILQKAKKGWKTMILEEQEVSLGQFLQFLQLLRI